MKESFENEKKIVWTSFIKEYPPLNTEVVIVYSSSPYNGMSFPSLGRRINDNFVILNSGLKIEICNSLEFFK